MWNQTYGSAKHEVAHWVIETSDMGFAIGGYIRNINAPEEASDFLLVKTDANGNMEWNQTYELINHDRVGSFVETSDGGFAITGGPSNFWWVKTDGYGNIEWSQTHGGSEGDIAHSLVETSDGGYAIAGETYSFGAEDSDFWLVKTDEHGIIPEFPS